MFTTSKTLVGRSLIIASAAAVVSALAFLAAGYWQALPSAVAKEPDRPAASPAEQPAAKLVVDPPKPEPLARGVAIVQFRSENVQIVPVFGPTAATVTPRLGHLHVTVDDTPWHWAHTSNDPVIVAPLPPGPHKILLELADADHTILAKEVVKFEVPRASGSAAPAQEKAKANADAEFLTAVTPAIAASVKVIEYAAKNASDEKVKDFAGRVAKQHKESVETATAHAKRLGIAVVTDPDKDSKDMIDKLSKLTGTDVDAAFLKWLGDIHTDSTVFEKEVKNGTDPDLKAYAKNSITAGHEHLHEASALLARLKK